MRMIEGQTFDMERALYGSRGVHLKDCSFEWPEDQRLGDDRTVPRGAVVF